jgi:hypothetical protein
MKNRSRVQKLEKKLGYPGKPPRELEIIYVNKQTKALLNTMIVPISGNLKNAHHRGKQT